MSEREIDPRIKREMEAQYELHTKLRIEDDARTFERALMLRRFTVASEIASALIGRVSLLHGELSLTDKLIEEISSTSMQFASALEKRCVK